MLSNKSNTGAGGLEVEVAGGGDGLHLKLTNAANANLEVRQTKITLTFVSSTKYVSVLLK